MLRHPLPRDFKSYLPFVVYLLLVTALLPRAAKFDYDYRKGTPWQYETLVAAFDFPIYKTEEQILDELSQGAADVIPYYRTSEDVPSAITNALDTVRLGEFEAMRADIQRSVRSIYELGVLSEENVVVSDRLGSISPELIYVHKGKRAEKYPLSSVLRVQGARERLCAELQPSYPATNVDSVLRYSGIYALLTPNLSYDRQTTEMVHRDSDASVSPTQGFVTAGTVIVSADELVTTEVAQVIDSYKREYESNIGSDMPVFVIWLVNLAIAFILALILFLVVFFAAPGLFGRLNELTYVVFVAFLAALPALLIVGRVSTNTIFFVPFTLVALYLQSFFDEKLTAPVYAASLLPLLVTLPQGIAIYLMFLLAGLLSMRFFHLFNKGWKQFVLALSVFAGLAAMYFVFKKASMLSGYAVRDLTTLFLGALLSVAGYQLVFVFERVFGLLSAARLDELCESSNPLLRELELKAPGTFQHSLQVRNMALSCARAIDADEHLISAGAMYHDIGKISNPRCFIENESLIQLSDGAKYHDGLTPQQSAHDITRHVTDGLDVAAKYGLPQALRQFIETHHGTTRANYFYNKFVNDGGDPAMAADFTYTGKKPRTREQLILMLCDSIEAASRTLKTYDAKSFSDFVDGIVASKTEEGQLDETDMTIRELNTVKDVIKNYLAQIYHERVAYPKRQK